MIEPVHVVGGGLAGCEAAWAAANAGVPVVLHEMRPVRGTEAHRTDALAELVCSNSFRSDDAEANAVGLLHAELRRLGSLVMATADRTQVPAGSALAVDREGFARAVTAAIAAHPLIRVERAEVAAPDAAWGGAIIATGPLTSPALAEWVRARTGADGLAFFDAIAPVVHREGVDMGVAWFQSRYDKAGPGGTGADYLNLPMDRATYEGFVAALNAAETVDFKDWERDTPYFDGCLPIEVMAARGPETLRHGPMKPRGLTNAHDPAVKPYAVVQLRQDNALGTLFNMVGFQTKMRHADQLRVFRAIPGLGGAEFARLGGIHRNTYLDSPRLLDGHLRLRAEPSVRFAGQVTGCEGYVESAALGLLAGRFAAAERRGRRPEAPPPTTMMGGLLGYVTGGHLGDPEGKRTFQPMNANLGLLPPLDEAPRGEAGKRLRGPEKALARKRALCARALADLDGWLGAGRDALAA